MLCDWYMWLWIGIFGRIGWEVYLPGNYLCHHHMNYLGIDNVLSEQLARIVKIEMLNLYAMFMRFDLISSMFVEFGEYSIISKILLRWLTLTNLFCWSTLWLIHKLLSGYKRKKTYVLPYSLIVIIVHFISIDFIDIYIYW